VPYAPPNVHSGRNDNNGYIDWGSNAERDVVGYRVYRVGSPDQLVCDMVTITRCKDTGLPTGAAQYYVRAVDRDNSGNLRNGDASAIASVPATDTPPTPVGNLQAAKPTPTSTILSWTAATDPDTGDSIQFYRIYRDGTDWVDDYYGETTGGSNFSFTDSATGSDQHTYWVVAVDQSFTESRPLGSGVQK
jgi:fibronectin type 3 domain-containing protein